MGPGSRENSDGGWNSLAPALQRNVSQGMGLVPVDRLRSSLVRSRNQRDESHFGNCSEGFAGRLRDGTIQFVLSQRLFSFAESAGKSDRPGARSGRVRKNTQPPRSGAKQPRLTFAQSFNVSRGPLYRHFWITGRQTQCCEKRVADRDGENR